VRENGTPVKMKSNRRLRLFVNLTSHQVSVRDRKRAWSTYARVVIYADSEQNFGVCRKSSTDLPHSRATKATMRPLAVIFALALITIAFEIYSDAALTTAEVSHTAAPDPAARPSPIGPTRLVRACTLAS